MTVMGAIVKRTTDLAVLRARAFAEANMQATVRIERPTAPVFDRSTGELGMAPDALVYQGKARVYGVQGPATYALGDEPQYFSSSFVSIPHGAAEPRIDDVVEVLTHPDASLVGRFFRIQDVEAGGQMPAVKRLQVVGIQPSRGWSES